MSSKKKVILGAKIKIEKIIACTLKLTIESLGKGKYGEISIFIYFNNACS
jgi:hypothetical protein